jgi:hypothetical protein
VYRTVVISLVASLVLLMVIFAAIRRGRLSVRYSMLWIVAGVAILVFSSSRGLLDVLASLLGIYYPPSALFLLATFFILVLLFHLTVAISTLKSKNARLAQEVALLRERIEGAER